LDTAAESSLLPEPADAEGAGRGKVFVDVLGGVVMMTGFMPPRG